MTSVMDAGAGKFLALLENISTEVADRKAGKPSAVQRRADHKRALLEFDLDRLIQLQQMMTKIVDTMTANPIDPDNLGVLTDRQAQDLMAEILDEITVKELLEARREMIREAVFAHITEANRAAGALEPENVNGSIEVPALRKKFCKEGTGRTAPTIDEEGFRAALGDRWTQAYRVDIIPEQVIPEHVEYTLDPDKVLALTEEDPAVMDLLREHLVPGAYRTPKFVVRDL